MDKDEYTEEEKRTLLNLARETIKYYLREGKREYLENTNPKFTESRGVFVTLHRSGELRGCIGYVMPIKSLFEAIADNAIASATEDHRFPPVTLDELSEIDIEISVLTVPREVSDIDAVKVGRDGIIISKGFNQGLLLPQVPVEQQWDLEQYISYGCMKAGLPMDEWRKGVQIKTFQAIVFGEKEMED